MATGEETRGIQIVANSSDAGKFVEIPLYNRTHAVIIGIDRYPNLPPDRQLTYAVSDAKAVERLLRSKYLFNDVYTLYNEEASRSNITDVLLNKLSGVSRDDAVFVFYAGHGGQETTDYGQIGFLVPYEGNFKDMRSVISMTTIRDDISKRIKAKHVFFVMDSCYSGTLVATRAAEARQTKRELAYLQQIAKEPVRQVLTAGDANQQVLDGGPGGHSVFTGRFLEILDGADDFITASEISAQVKERVFSDARARNHVQTPKDGEFFGLGDFIFMPSTTKKLGSLKDQIAEMDRELASLKDVEAQAGAAKNDAARREAERKRREVEARLAAKKLEEERLGQEETERTRRMQERSERQEAAKRRQMEEEQRLAGLQREVMEKRKTYKASMITSLSGALAEMQTLDKEIRAIRDRYREELKGRVMAIIKAHSESFGDVTLKKDEFETEAEYRTRLAAGAAGSGQDNKAKYQSAVNAVSAEYLKQIAPLKVQMEEIAKARYTVYGHDGLKLALGRYDAEGEGFAVTVASLGILRPIYPQQHLLVLTEAGGQAVRAGLRPGDIVLRYNGHDVDPATNWDILKQTVLSATTTMDVDRDGKMLTVTLQKGDIGIDTTPDDYLPKLTPNQFMVNGFLSVPRAEARQFKQNFGNTLVTAELQVSAATPDLSLVKSAFIVDEGTGKRYDLFLSDYVNLGNRITWDRNNRIYWISKRLHKLSFTGAEKFLNGLVYRGGSGWHLPDMPHLETIRSKSATWRYGFHQETFHTRTATRDGRHHVQYRPSDGRTDSGDSETEGVLAVANTIVVPPYPLLEDRFVTLAPELLFDGAGLVVWLMRKPDRELTYLEAESYVKQFSHSGLRGWRLPELQELRCLWDPAIPGVDGRYRDIVNQTVYSRTKTSDGRNHVQCRPTDQHTDAGDNERDRVLPVL
jgi:uncharacterized caspase-like protein